MPSTLNVTALTAANGISVLECWALDPGFVSSSQVGTTGASSLQLGNLANGSYSILPPRFNAGLHNAPNVQCVPSSSDNSDRPLTCCCARRWP